ncbi:glycosyl hydrolase [Phytohabitans sp. ZYX-F-186]|uniref:Glycosyl hydrolase n=1 Tax=Phytohabitans maris TaxID=3071409 RepID=A0ABU0ZNZ6_9ACTN|nr:glycosyl hydrolase [Phytohabitans sp. ZYX-F-186]MDQ7908763.1 glycosyl hydrolase [Phytohabitans sp. ZYX-F-186]
MKEISPGFSSYNARQIWWADVATFSGYVARSQAVKQAGQAKVDLAVLLGSDAGFTVQSGNSLQGLLNHGYSYNLLSEALLQQPSAVVSDGVLAADGPNYRALILRQVTQLSVAAVQKITDYARRGLPVILYDCDVTRVYGTNQPGNNDTLLAAAVAKLTKLSTVSTATPEAEVLAALDRRRISPAASYHVPNLEATRRQTRDASYYYLFNAGTTLAAPAEAGATGIRLVSTAGLSPGDTLLVDVADDQETVTVAAIPTPAPAAPAANVALVAPLSKAHAGPAAALGPWGVPKGAVVSSLAGQKVTLRGDGVPYLLDAWTGQITAIAEYTTGPGTVTVGLDLEPRDAVIVALVTNAPKRAHVTALAGGEAVYTRKGGLLHRAYVPGSYTASLSNGRRRTVTVRSVPDVLSLPDGWSLELQSWGPDPAANAVDPTASAKTTVTFAGVTLGVWDDLPATSAHLAKLGVDGMGQVSGVGRYSRSFHLPTAWARAGAILYLRHRDDMVVRVRLNGAVIEDVDQFTDRVDVGDHLRIGANTVEVTTDTTLNNRMGDFDNPDKIWAGGASGAQTYGLTGVRLIPYVTSEVL